MCSVMRFLFLFLFSSSLGFAKIDDSVDLFFPTNLKYLQYSQTEFPVFWWNFAVVQPQNGQADYVKAQKLCADLKSQIGGELRRLVCGDDLSSFEKALNEWAQDLPLREKAPS